MKKIYLPVLMAAVLLVVACTKTGLDPLKGTFTAPVELPLQASSLKSSNTSKDDAGRRIFDMDFEQGGTAIHFKLVGDKYFISAGAYIEAEDSKAKKGNFISGLTTVGGKKVKQGTINFQVLNTTETKENILNNICPEKQVQDDACKAELHKRRVIRITNGVPVLRGKSRYGMKSVFGIEGRVIQSGSIGRETCQSATE